MKKRDEMRRRRGGRNGERRTMTMSTRASERRGEMRRKRNGRKGEMRRRSRRSGETKRRSRGKPHREGRKTMWRRGEMMNRRKGAARRRGASKAGWLCSYLFLIIACM